MSAGGKKRRYVLYVGMYQSGSYITQCMYNVFTYTNVMNQGHNAKKG